MSPNPTHGLTAEQQLEITRDLRAARTLPESVLVLHRHASALMGISHVAVGILLPSRTAVSLHLCGPGGTLPSPRTPLPLDGTAVGHVLREHSMELSQDLQSAALRFPDEEVLRSHEVRWQMTLPLEYEGRVLGVIILGSTASTPFEARDSGPATQLLEPFSAHLHAQQLQDRLRKRVERAEILTEIEQTAISLSSPREVFDVMFESARRSLQADRLILIERRGDLATTTFIRAATPELQIPLDPFPVRESSIEDTLLRGEAYLHRLGPQNVGLFPQIQALGLQAAIGVPVSMGGTGFATLAASSRDFHAFTASDLDFLGQLGGLLGRLLERLRLLETEDRLVSNERILYELSVALSGQVQIADIFEIFMGCVRRLLSVQWGMAFEFDGERAIPLVTDAPASVRESCFHLRRVEDLAALEPLRQDQVHHPRRDLRDSPRLNVAPGLWETLTVPILHRGQLRGWVHVQPAPGVSLPEGAGSLMVRAARSFALAVTNSRSYIDAQRLAQRERDLLELSNLLTQTRDPQALLPVMSRALQRLVDADRALVLSVEGAMISGSGQGDIPMHWRETAAAESIELQEPRRYVRGASDSPPPPLPSLEPYLVTVYVPVVAQGQVLAMLALGSREEQAFPQGDILTLRRAAAQFGLALDNALAHVENLRLAQRERDFLQLANAITMHRDPQDILQMIVPTLGRLMWFQPGDLAAVLESDGEQLRLVACNLPSLREPGRWPNLRWSELPMLPPGGSGNSRRLLVEELSAPLAARMRALNLSVVALVPLAVQDRSVGLFWVGSHRLDAYAGEELETLARVAQQFGLAMEAARGYREVESRGQKLEMENLYLKEELLETAGGEEIVGVGPALAHVRNLVRKVARTDTVVLIRGESGTGKELVAEAVHRFGDRADRPLIRVNCAALPESLISSELFGHEKGAYTGAYAQRIGRFELARGGTIFLDEIGDLSLEVQSNLLRVIQQGEFERVGSSTTLHTNARVIAATNRNLEVAVAEAKFRPDLFYRLNVFPIHLPALRDRKEDIPVLAYYFLYRFSRKLGKSIQRISPECEQPMADYPWPGNIRELQNVIERAVILCDSDELYVELGIPAEPTLHRPERSTVESPAPPLGSRTSHTLADAERSTILQALRAAGGRVAGPGGAAVRLGLKRTTLNSKMKRLGIQRTEYLQ